MHPLYNTSCIKHDIFSKVNLNKYPELFVLIGFIAADGCVFHPKNGQNRLIFNISNKDIVCLNSINHIICSGKRKLSNLTSTNSSMFYVSSNNICQDLSMYNIHPRKTKTMRLPNLSKLEMSYYLRGYFYGDGNCYRRTVNCYRYSIVGNDLIIHDIRDWLTTNSIVDSIGYYKNKHSKNTSEIIMNCKYGIQFADFIYQDDKYILLPRKHKPHLC